MAAAQWKFTIKRGQTKKDVTLAAGTTISGSDAIELNVDCTNMTRMEFQAALEEVTIAAIDAKYPAA